MSSHLALLRAINVGGKTLPMKALAELFAAAGCRNVRTYIQSGNVLFDANAALAAKVPGAVADAIRKRFGFEAPVVVRSLSEMEQVVKANPFKAPGDTSHHVMFLADEPDAKSAGALDPKRSPGDSFRVVGREVYLHLPNGAGRSKLTVGWFDSKLRTVSTARNWRTVCTLLEMMRDGAAS